MLTTEHIAYRWVDAFNKHDVALLISLYAKHGIHSSPKLRAAQPETGGRIMGHLALAEWWKEAFRRIPELRYELTFITPSPSRVFIEYLRHVPGEDTTSVAEVFEIQHGLILSSRVYHG